MGMVCQTCQVGMQQNDEDVSRYYYFQCNSSPSFDDCVIKLVQGKDRLKGFFYGCSDESDAAHGIVREGFLPGFFVLEMKNLQIAGDSIFFYIDNRQNADAFLSKPVELIYTSNGEALETGHYHRWLQEASYFADSIYYSGKIQADAILLMNHRDSYYKTQPPRLFKSVSEKEAMTGQRTMSDEIERTNRE